MVLNLEYNLKDMKINAISTPIVQPGDNLLNLMKENLPPIPERSVIVVVSKILSYSQGRLVDFQGSLEEKQELIKQEADYYLPAASSRYNLILTIKNASLTVNAGVDESNANDKLVLWPENMQQEVNNIWRFLRSEFQLNQVGVIITDSRTWPMRWGVVGTCLAHCGFKQLNDHRGQPDLFGREIHFVQVNVAEALSSMAVLEMGEVAEQTPLGIITDIREITFQDREPSQEELAELQITKEDDMYGPLLTSMNWEQGGGGVKLGSSKHK